MTVKGVVRQLDPVGRVVIPIEFRKLLDIKPGDPLEIILTGNEVVIRKFSEACVFCGSKEGLKKFKGLNVCSKCRKQLTKEIP